MISKDNKLVKTAKKLKAKKTRDKENLFLAEGVRFVEEAIQNNSAEYILYSDRIYSTKGFERILETSENIFKVEDSVLIDICETESPQGVVAICNKKSHRLETILGKILVVIDGVQDPGNLGTIIRTCDAAGVSGIIILKGTVDVYNSKVLRSTMGSVFHIPIIFEDDFKLVADVLIKNKYNILAASLEGKKSLYDYDFSNKTAVILGNEANGVQVENMNIATDKIIIPMEGKAESLNVGVANSIIVYEALRQRLFKS